MKKFLLLTMIMCLFGGLSSSLMAQFNLTYNQGAANQYTLTFTPTSDNECAVQMNKGNAPGANTDLVIPATVENNGQTYNVVSIPNNAFSGASTYIGTASDYFTSLTIPNTVVSIGSYAFRYWSNCTTVILGEGVTSISNNAFANSSSITTIYCYANTPPTYGGNAVFHTTVKNNAKVYVPANSLNEYKKEATSGSGVGWAYININNFYAMSSTPTPPDAPTLTSPTNGATTGIFNPSLNFTLSNNTAKYQIFLAEAAGTGAGDYTPLTSLVDKTNNTVSYQTSNLKPNTTYYWYVVAKNDKGEVPSAEYSFTTSNFGVPGIPTLVSPENNATIAENPNLSWNFGEYTEQYQVLFGTDSDNLDVVQAWTSTLATSYQTNNLAVGDYFWKIVVKNNVGETSSEVFKFTKLGAPDNVTPISPADGATEVSNKTIRFTFAPNTTHYRFLYGESAGTLAYCGHGTTTTWLETGGVTEMEITAPDFETGMTYYWAVDVKNGSGQRTVHQGGDAIDVFHFTTSSITAATNLRSTLNNNEVTLTWFYGNSNTVDEYQVLFGTDQDNLAVVQDWTSRGDLSEGSFFKDGLEAGTTYYWQVNVRKDGGDALSSEIASFTTNPLPDAPTLNSPSNNEEVTTDPKLSWTFGDNTDEYQLLFGTASDNLDVVQDWTSTLATSYQTSGLALGDYFWKVVARNSIGETSSEVFKFTKLGAPDNVTPISPADGATEVNNKTIRFTFAEGTVKYRTLYDRGYGFEYVGGSDWKSTNDATTGEFTLPEFGTGKTYRWAVDVQNDYGKRTIHDGGDEIAIYSFTTSSITAATNLISTLNNREVTLTWFYGNGNTVNEYQVLFGTDQDNLAVVQDWTSRGDLSEGSFFKDGLEAGTTYYWQVNVRKDGGDALSSEIASFTTNSLPGTVTYVSPADNASLNADPKLSWTFGINTTEYQVLFGTDSDNLEVVQDWTSSLATSYQTNALKANVTYYWQVNVRNDMGEVQGNIYSFIKSVRPDNATPIFPSHGETGVSNVATITWKFASNTTHYKLLFNRGYGFEYQVGNKNTWIEVTGETASFNTEALGLGASKTCYWAVEVKNDNGERNYYNGANPSGDVEVYSYTTTNVIAATYQSPANNSVLSTPTATLEWTYGANNTVTHYQVLFGTDKNNLDVVQDWAEIPTVGTGLGDGTYTTATLTNNTKYYWQVNVKQDTNGTTLEGQIWAFVSTLDIPQNVTSDAVSYNGTAHLTWDAIADATSYNIYVDGTLYSTVNTNAADIANLVYNNGKAYSIQISAVYEFDGITYESAKSDIVEITAIGYGKIDVLVKDYKDNSISGATITLNGKDVSGNDKEYTFTTNANGTYISSKPEICEGTYTVTISKDLYFTQTIENVVIANNETKNLGTIILHSMAIFNVTVNDISVDHIDIFLGYNTDEYRFETRPYNIYVWEIHEDTYDPNYIERWFSIGATQGENAMYRYFEWENLPNGVYRIGVEFPGSGIINWSNVNAYKNYYIFEKNGNWYDSENWRDGLMPQLPDDQVYIYAEAVVNEDETVTIGNVTIKYDNKDYFGSLTINGNFTTTTNIGIVNESPHRLILNDGAQLRQKNPNLPGKFVMNINNPKVWNEWNKTGWQFIASPFTNAEVSQFTETGDEYDLYKFDGRHENLTEEWRNHKDATANFETEFVSGRGYMASYESNTTATLSGTFNSSTSITYPVTYQEIQEGEMHWPNFHLLGNPFTFNMDLSKLQTFHMATGVAVVNNTGGWDYLTSGSINVGDGFFVRTVGVNPSVSYSEESTRSSNNDDNVSDNISIRVSNSTSRDNVVLNFAGADNAGFPKLNAMNEDVAYLYVVDNNERYGIFNYDKDVKEVPLSFEVQKMGKYTISVDAEGEYETIVLVDRQTGIETNMLLEDYNFTATTSKKENTDRFIVRFTFKSDVETESEIFAYQSGNELIIEDEGTVQLFDVTGRMLHISDIKSRGERINVGQFNKAAYILRLVNGEGVKVQKVIIY